MTPHFFLTLTFHISQRQWRRPLRFNLSQLAIAVAFILLPIAVVVPHVALLPLAVLMPPVVVLPVAFIVPPIVLLPLAIVVPSTMRGQEGGAMRGRREMMM